MKQTPLILSIIALVAVAAIGICLLVGDGDGKKKSSSSESAEAIAQQGAIVWYDLDRVTSEYDMANDLSTVVNTKIQSVQEEIDRRSKNFQTAVNKFQSDYQKGILVSSVAQQRQQKLQEQEASLNNFVNQKQQEMAEEQQVMINQVTDAIKTYLDKFNEDHKYAMIIATQGSVLPIPVSVADPDAIIVGLNEEYVKSKQKGTSSSDDSKAE